jgi:hypothetical protein
VGFSATFDDNSKRHINTRAPIDIQLEHESQTHRELESRCAVTLVTTTYEYCFGSG